MFSIFHKSVDKNHIIRMKDEYEISNRFVQLLIISEIQELETKFYDIPDKTQLIEQHICRFAMKPGFALVAQYCKDADIHLKSLKDISFFFTTKVSRLIFGSSPICIIEENKLIVDYTDSLPSWFTCLGVPKKPLSFKSQQWFRYFTNFIAGVIIGIFMHFGYRATLTIDSASFESLKFTIEANVFEDSWEIEAANSM